MRKTFLGMLWLLIGSCTWTGCSDDNDTPSLNDNTSLSLEILYANMFGKEAMSYFYYWNTDILNDLMQWDIETNEDPIGTVDQIRYHEGDKYIDKWTMMTNDVEAFNNSVEGISTTFGWNLTVYRLYENSNQCVGVINYVSAGSPAEQAGLKRGDIIGQLNGENITTENYLELIYASSLTIELITIDRENQSIKPSGEEVELNAITMYENPILCDSIYEFNGKKVGYLAYTSFDMNAIPQLVEIGKEFKAEGVSELVLDLRYNGGGYVITENVLASMFAPQAAVDAQEIFEKEVYNDILMEAYQKNGIDLNTRFKTEHTFSDINGNQQQISTKDANIGLDKVYGIISSNTASASESLLGGLMPYMDVELIGSASHGKYCTGVIFSGDSFYENCPDEIKNWGIYVMVSIYQNAAGETPCMPDGLQPDIQVTDEQIPTYQLGNVNEPLLRAALTEAGRKYDTEAVQSRSSSPVRQSLPVPHKASFEKRILQSSDFIQYLKTIK